MEKIKEIFNLIKNLDEGIYGKLHIIDIESDYDYESQNFKLKKYRIYHADGYCFEVSREKIDLVEDESCELIDGFYYNFDSEMFEGFKELSIQECIVLIKKYK
jgi:hypothetical protein